MAEQRAMREALEHIIAGGEWECERFTTGIGSCFRQGMTPQAQYWSGRCCPSCIAHHGLLSSLPPPLRLISLLKKGNEEWKK